jgi:hypothetical protein
MTSQAVRREGCSPAALLLGFCGLLAALPTVLSALFNLNAPIGEDAGAAVEEGAGVAEEGLGSVEEALAGAQSFRDEVEGPSPGGRHHHVCGEGGRGGGGTVDWAAAAQQASAAGTVHGALQALQALQAEERGRRGAAQTGGGSNVDGSESGADRDAIADRRRKRRPRRTAQRRDAAARDPEEGEGASPSSPRSPFQRLVAQAHAAVPFVTRAISRPRDPRPAPDAVPLSPWRTLWPFAQSASGRSKSRPHEGGVESVSGHEVAVVVEPAPSRPSWRP